MFRKLIHPILVFPFCLYINSQEALLSKANNNIEEILHENENQIFLNYSEIDNITLKNNQELKACLLYTSPSPRDVEESRMPSSA